jgi:hypothetical protein
MFFTQHIYNNANHGHTDGHCGQTKRTSINKIKINVQLFKFIRSRHTPQTRCVTKHARLTPLPRLPSFATPALTLVLPAFTVLLPWPALYVLMHLIVLPVLTVLLPFTRLARLDCLVAFALRMTLMR